MKQRTIIGLAILVLAATAVATSHHDQHEYQHRNSWWQGFKNALSDMNPFTNRLGSDWMETHHRVENIYEDMHRMAQKKVESLSEDGTPNKELQERIAEIYVDAAKEAEQRIERLKRPLFGALWRQYPSEEEADEQSSYEKYTTMARNKMNDVTKGVNDGYDSIKKKFSGKPAHEATHLFEETSKSVSDAYHKALAKAKEAASKVQPMAGETWHQTKARAQRLYDDVMHQTHKDTRPLYVRMGDGLKGGIRRAGEFVETAAVKTWHLVLHIMLGSMWMILGAIGITVAKTYWDKYLFKRQLASQHTGPVVLSKEFVVVGDTETQNKFFDYWTGAASDFMKRQPGMRKMVVGRGLDLGRNVYNVSTEFDTIENLRRMLKSPDLEDMKKRMPRATLSRHLLGQISQTVKGPAWVNEKEGTGERLGSEGLRQRTTAGTGPGT